jgi:hypothetical protein
MASRTDRRLYLVAAAFIAAVTSAYAAWRYTNGVVMSDEVGSTYNLVMALLVVTWVVADPKIPPAHRPSFDHAALVWHPFHSSRDTICSLRIDGEAYSLCSG